MRYIDKNEVENFIDEGYYTYWGKYSEGISRLASNSNEYIEDSFIYEGQFLNGKI
jgi:hypothetical protein